MKAFLILFVSKIVLIFLFQYYIDFESLYNLTFDEDLKNIFTQKQQVLNWNQKYLLPFLFILIQLIIKIIVISLVLFTGLFFITETEGIKSLGIIFSSVCIAELVFVIEKAINLVVFISHPDLTLDFIRGFSPFSLYGIIGDSLNLDYLTYLFKSINLYEIAYIFALAYLIGDNLNLHFVKSLKTTFLSYGSLMACWVVFITYMILNTSP